MNIQFEPTRSYVYRAARYEVLPALAEEARKFGEDPFRLTELTNKYLSEHYSSDQLEIRIPRAQSEGTNTIKAIFRFYIPFLAKKLQVFDYLGDGLFQNISLEEEIAEADAVSADVDDDHSGMIYAYSFPMIKKTSGRFPIKIGLTTTGDVQARVMQQCKQTCCFEFPELLGSWEVQRVGSVERAIHATLEARALRREAPGAEWFDTTVSEIASIVSFIGKAQQDAAANP